ncbi:serine/threonine protein phosphatase 1 [Aliiroseovarius halocynthiae]|uniref:Serine/threonine protein phosphatase n=1 Tax=Aliiroseovarius halocynthiae TaxID=985055 RepID=A0A545SUN7_9RHOB|nr:metallophosphoesterase [Aliiroseovarius halocynthiae]TQV68663.1 serine/threonine protein phosphatase [Aliiroseovarius halocynthiae]SMR71083.1 serine/threonine protein phosphatase 1 [Aliiroseovarius halocynthiae]
MGKLLNSLLRKFGGNAKFNAPLAPDQPFLVIGDIHGCFDALCSALDRIASESELMGQPLVFVGDYLDRGPQSSGVLRRLMALQASGERDVICLRGNHEQLLLNFLENPALHAPVWFANGGVEALRSFGIRASKQDMRGDRVLMLSARLKQEMGADSLAFLQGLPHIWQTGNVAVSHAGADPGKPLDMQEEQVLIWGHPAFTSQPRKDGIWMVHGHTIVPQVVAQDGRISVDTGAFQTGVLPVVSVSRDGVRVVGQEDRLQIVT